MTQHTPGPWEWSYGDMGQDYSVRYCTVSADDGDLHVAEVNDLFDFHIGHANACLIAAAPDLLDMLEEIADTLEHFAGCRAAELRGKIVAAIAKARGES